MMHPMPEINTLLKQLKLSNMYEHIAERNREAIERHLSYPEFFALLLQDEMMSRESKKFIARLTRSGLEADKTLENFDFLYNPKISRPQIQDLATCRFIAEKAPVLIAGPCGTGKSHIAQALGHCAIRQGIDVLWMTQTRMLNDLQTAKAVGRYEKKLMTLVKVSLLIIDDFGLKPLRSPQDEDFHILISERYERVPTIVTSNLEWSEWGDAFPNRLLAAATLDRLRDQAYLVPLEGDTYRRSRNYLTGKKTVSPPRQEADTPAVSSINQTDAQ